MGFNSGLKVLKTYCGTLPKHRFFECPAVKWRRGAIAVVAAVQHTGWDNRMHPLSDGCFD
jgi:hypothetical protein